MIVYGFFRRFTGERTARIAATLCYALMLTLIAVTFSQIGADLRYANL